MAQTLAFLQARMGSSRLPGKVLLRIRGKTILERAIERLRAAKTIDGVVVLTTGNEEDGAIGKEATRLEVETYFGPELDVLERFLQAARRFQPGIIVRATADNPLIDIGSVDRAVHSIGASNLDYCMERDLPYGAATEAVTWKALERVGRLATEPHHREHVTLYIKDHPEDFRMALISPPDRLRRPEIRVTVDTVEDFLYMERLLESVDEGQLAVPLERYLRIASVISRARV